MRMVLVAPLLIKKVVAAVQAFIALVVMEDFMKGDLMALILKTVLATLLNELIEAVVGSQVKKVLKWLQDCF